MDRRKAELEAKRAKLEELRRAREQRKSAFTAEQRGAETPSERPPSAARRAQLDELVTSLLAGGSANDTPQTTSALSTPALPPGIPSGRQSRLSDAPGTSERGGSERESFGTTLVQPEGTSYSYDPSTSSMPDFTETAQELFEYAPKPRLMYDKAIQTNLPYGRSTETTSSDVATGGVGSSTLDEAELRAKIIRELDDAKARLDVEIAEEKRRRDEELEVERKKGLSPDALSTIYASADFSAFVDASSKIVQRALSDGYDYLRDYTIGGESVLDDSEGSRVRRICIFSDDRWTRNRSVTALDWSSKYPELCAAAYNKNPLAVSDPDGIVCVWNMHLLERPEFVFHSQSDVLSCTFSPFHPNYVIGGTYSGQILLWDTRAKHLPVLKTPLSATGHTHPVYSLSLVGTQNAHNLISASTDGLVCAWTLDLLARPAETLELTHPAHAKTDEVAITSLAFPDNEATTFYVGTEEGTIFGANRYDRAGAKAGLAPGEVYRGHSGSVTGLHFHPLAGPVDFSDLFLTCGVDWTVKLWRARGQQQQQQPASATTSLPSTATSPAVQPMYSFEEADDYVFDVRWHPVHPAVFGTVDGAGKFDVWNLNADTEVPASTTVVSPEAPKGLNKLAWDRREGRRAALGSSDGQVHVYDVGNLATPAENEWDATRKTIAGLMADFAGQTAASTGPQVGR